MLVYWNDPALAHLEAIREFLARGSAAAAESMVNRIMSRSAQLEEFPRSGALLPGAEALEIRFLVEGPYRIVYAIIRGRVEVLGVVHAGRRSL
jgi:plasmid stabilization system protein ParE